MDAKWWSRGLLVGLMVAGGGCEPVEPPAGSTGAPAASVAPKAQAAPEVPAAPPDLDVEALKKELKCGDQKTIGPCGVLHQWASCKAWDGRVPSADGRWIGHGFRFRDGGFTDLIALLRVQTVPTDDVGPGQLPIRVSVTELPSENSAHESAADAIRAFSRHDVPSRKNPAVTFVEETDDWPSGSFATHTVSKQIYAISKAGTYLCQGAQQQLLLVERSATRGAAADGIYAELWATTW